MKRKMKFWMLTLFILSAASVNAQVSIGSSNAPHKGAILDLSQSGSDLGILFPRVDLQNPNDFQLQGDVINAIGMVVYNINSGLPDGAGLYVWDGSEWKSVSNNAGSHAPVTAEATLETNRDNGNAKITVNVTAGAPAYSYIWSKNGNVVWITHTNAKSDSYTTTGAGVYTVTVSSLYTATPVSFSFTDNGNGTRTDSQGNLIYEEETYSKVDSDVPGIYLDEDGEIVYTGADGIPGNEDDNVFVVPDYPLPTQKTLFSIEYPVAIGEYPVAVRRDKTYQMKLDFADGRTYPGTGKEGEQVYNGKIKFMSNDSSIISISETGFMTVGSVQNVSVTLTIILGDGSIIHSFPSVRPTTTPDDYKLARVVDNNVNVVENSIKKLDTSIEGVSGTVNAWTVDSLTYAINSGVDTTSSTVTPGGWFHAGKPGVVTVTATATDDAGESFTGTITVKILGEPSEEIPPYETATTNWAALEPAPAYAGGDGTEAKPYQISSVRQFKKLSVDIELLGSTDATYQKYFELTTDLDFSDDKTVTGSLIGTFYGTFDGKGHVIKNLDIDATGKSQIALFTNLAFGEIKNLGREGGSITGSDANNVAGLVASITSGGKLSNCYNSSFINVTHSASGLASSIYGSTIRNCYNTGDITISGANCGGLVSHCLWDGGNATILNSYNTGNVNSLRRAGGIIGFINSSQGNKQTLNLSNTFNFGDVTIIENTGRVGSIIGHINETTSALVEINATNVYSRPNVASADNRNVPKENQPIGWQNNPEKNIKDAILAANPTLEENAKYTLEYSRSEDFAAELGGAFKHAPNRTPKLAWEKD